MSNLETRTETQLVRTGPSYLADLAKTDKSLAATMEYRVLPRLKVVQSQSKRELRDPFGIGGVILHPLGQQVAEASKPFLIVPVFFFTEYITMSDMDDGETPTIIGRTFDKQDPIAVKSRNAETREERYGMNPKKKEPYTMRHQECLCLASVIYGNHPLAGNECVVVFKGGEWGVGKNFTNAFHTRKVEGHTVPLYCQVWELRSAERPGDQYSWWGLNFANPSQSEPYITNEEVPVFKKAHETMAALYAGANLGVDMSDADEVKMEHASIQEDLT